MEFVKRPIKISAEYNSGAPVTIPTLEGDMVANTGDWIITGVNGEKYPCKPDIFIKTYEPVDDEAKEAFWALYGHKR